MKHTVNRSLTTQLFQHFSSTGKSVTGFTNGDVEDEFLDAELAHGVRVLIFARVRLLTLDSSVLSEQIESLRVASTDHSC